MEHGVKDIVFYVQKDIYTLHSCHNFPAGSRQAARSARTYCLTHARNSDIRTKSVSPNRGKFKYILVLLQTQSEQQGGGGGLSI